MSTRKISYLLFTLLIAAAFLVSSSIPSATAQFDERTTKLIEGAKKEGMVSYLTCLIRPPTNQRLAAAFKKKYNLGDDFKVQHAMKGTGAIAALMVEEFRSGRVTIDVLTSATPEMWIIAEKNGWLMAYESPEWMPLPRAGESPRHTDAPPPLGGELRPPVSARLEQKVYKG